MKSRYIPNLLSVIRILMVFVFVFFFFHDYPNYVPYSLVIFLLAGLTDVVDGILARKYNWITNLGKLLDPLADKFMQCVALACLYIKNYIPFWLLLFFVAKELTVGFGALFMLKRRDVIVVSKWYGKLSVCIFYAAVLVIVMLGDKLGNYIYLVYSITVASALLAIIVYYISYVKSKTILRNFPAKEIEKNQDKKERL